MNGTVAILCSGQGTQHAGMFDLVAQSVEARPILDVAREWLGGKDPQRFVREADPVTLFSNRAGQVLCCTQALAAWAMLRPHLPARVVLAGYSVGELAAWGCAGLIESAEVLRLADERAQLMDKAAGPNTGLSAIMGLNEGRVEALCRAHGAHIAIVNDETFFVVGGEKNALEAMCKESLSAGATKASFLKVAVASHTPILAAAAREFGARLDQLYLLDQVPGEMRLLSGTDGEAVFGVRDGVRRLAAQISQTLQWKACLDNCRATGPDAVLELGPGRALASMADRNLSRPRVRSMDDFRTPAGVITWLGT